MPRAARRRCTGSPTCPALLPAGARFCPRHAQEYEARRGTREDRGYGAAHERERARWQRRIDAGEDVRCADGCGTRILGTAWHLGHSEDRSVWLGPQTIACNLRDAGRRGAARSNRT